MKTIYVFLLALLSLSSCYTRPESRERQSEKIQNIKKIKILGQSSALSLTTFVKGREVTMLSSGDTVLVMFHPTLGYYVMHDDMIAPNTGEVKIAVVQ